MGNLVFLVILIFVHVIFIFYSKLLLIKKIKLKMMMVIGDMVFLVINTINDKLKKVKTTTVMETQWASH